MQYSSWSSLLLLHPALMFHLLQTSVTPCFLFSTLIRRSFLIISLFILLSLSTVLKNLLGNYNTKLLYKMAAHIVHFHTGLWFGFGSNFNFIFVFIFYFHNFIYNTQRPPKKEEITLQKTLKTQKQSLWLDLNCHINKHELRLLFIKKKTKGYGKKVA